MELVRKICPIEISIERKVFFSVQKEKKITTASFHNFVKRNFSTKREKMFAFEKIFQEIFSWKGLHDSQFFFFYLLNKFAIFRKLFLRKYFSFKKIFGFLLLSAFPKDFKNSDLVGWFFFENRQINLLWSSLDYYDLV